MKFLKQLIDELTYTSIISRWSDFDWTKTYSTETDENNLTDASVVKFGNYYYRSIIDNNKADSTLDTPEAQLNRKWIRWSVSNRYAMIDLRATTKSIIDTTPTFTTTGVSQTVDLAIGDIIWYYTASSSTGDGVLFKKYEAITVQTGVDLDTVDFITDTTNYKDAIVDLVVEFTKGIIDTVAIGYYSAKELTVDLLDGADTIVFTTTISTSANEEVTDYYDYIYSTYSIEVNRGRLINLPQIGIKARVTFTPLFHKAYCGFLIGAEGVDMGDTASKVNFSFNSFSSKTVDSFGIIDIKKRGVQDLLDFETTIKTTAFNTAHRNIKTIYDDIVGFSLDPSDTSAYENLITLGTIESSSVILNDSQGKSHISWSIQEVI